MWRRWALLVVWLWCGMLQAQPVVSLATPGGAVALKGSMQWLREPGGRWTADEAARADGWQALQGSPNAGFTNDAVWLRLRLEQPPGGASWRLQVDNTLIEQVSLYQRDAAGTWHVQEAGRSVRHSDWPLDTRSPVFRLDLPAGTHEFMLRLATRNSLSTSIHLLEAEHFYARAQKESLLWGIYFGIYALVILIQFLFWKWTREALSGWYVMCAGLNCFSMLLTMGYLQNALNWSGALAVPMLSLAICASIYVATQFTAIVLELERYMPRLNQFLLRAAAVVSIVSAAIVLAGAVALGTVIAQATSIVLMLSLAGATVVMLIRRGEMAERFLLVAFGFFFLGVLLRYLRNLGWLDAGAITDNSVQVGSVLHMSVMCVFIVYRYNALRIALQVEQAARQEQRDFVALVSHEFRTPLAIIDTSAQQLASHLDAPPERSLKRCANIQAASRRMSDLMDNYLTLDRMGHFEHAFQARPCDLPALLGHLAAEWPANRVRLQTEQLPTEFTCDPDLLRVALRNLISNAHRHAAPSDPIELLAQGLPNGQLRLRVTNVGDTIPADEMPLLFQRYRRGRSARGKPGAGLGLFLAQQIVQAHGGRITARSQAGITSFQIQLPAREPSGVQVPMALREAGG